MADTLKPDLCIIGAGALGIEMAVAARGQGAAVVLVDRGAEPGEGGQYRLHRLALLASAARAEALRTAGRLGLDGAEPKPNFRAVGEHAARVAAAALPRDSDDRLTALGITVVAGAPAFLDRNTLKAGETTIRAGHYLFATGDRPLLPVLPGLDAVSYFTPDTILDNLRKITHLVVIGGGAEALESAQAYRRLGSAVTVVPQGAILPGFDREPVAVLLRELAEAGVAVLEGASVTAIQPRSQGTGIALRRADGTDETLDVSHILLALGRVPDLDPAIFEKARLKPDPTQAGRPLLDAAGQTSNRRIAIVGASAGFDDPALVSAHARAALGRMLGAGTRLDPAPVVRHVLTDPPVAQVGLVDTGTLPAGTTVLRANGSETDAARARGETTGAVKLLVAANGTLRGGAMVGAGAIETMSLLALAIGRAMTMRDLSSLTLPATSPAFGLVDLARQQPAAKQAGRWRQPGDVLRRLRP